MLLLLGLLMPLMWLCTSLLVWRLLPLGLVPAMLVGAALAPTEPVVASSIVVGPAAEKNLPARRRVVISAESGANDGLAYPFVLFPMLLLPLPADEIWPHWLLQTLLHEVVGAALLGILMSWLSGHLLLRFHGERGVGHVSFLACTLALTRFLLGAARLMGTDGVLTVLVGGTAYDWVIRDEGQQKQRHIQGAIGEFFTLPAFARPGLAIPIDEWLDMGWAAGVPLLRRLPALLLLAPALLRLARRGAPPLAGHPVPGLVRTRWHCRRLLCRARHRKHGGDARLDRRQPRRLCLHPGPRRLGQPPDRHLRQAGQGTWQWARLMLNPRRSSHRHPQRSGSSKHERQADRPRGPGHRRHGRHR